MLRSNRQHVLAAGLMAFFLAVMLYNQAHPRLVDDAFITFRYVARAAHGDGLVYNPSERVLGTTSPGYAFVLLPLAIITNHASLPYAAWMLNSFLMVVVMGHAALIAYKVTGRLLTGAALAGLVAVSPWTLGAAVSGMESALFLALVSGGLLAWVVERDAVAVSLFGLSVSVRPEGGLIIGLMLLALGYQYYHRQRSRRSWLALSLVMLVPGLVYALLAVVVYGSPIPQSIQAKAAGLYPFPIFETALAMLFELSRYAVYPFIMAGLVADTSIWGVGLGAMVVSIVALVGARCLVRTCPRLWIVPAYVGLTLVFYASSRTLLFNWYFANYEVALLACYWAGWWVLAQKAIFRKPRDHWASGAGVTAAVLISTAIMTLDVTNPADSITPPLSHRELAYYDLARQIEPLLSGEPVIAMPEIGVLGYYLPSARVLDTAGLVSPEAVDYFPVPAEQRKATGTGAVPPLLIQREQPDMVILFEVFGEKNILEDGWFLQHYVLVVEWEQAVDEVRLLVYARHDYVPGLALADASIEQRYH